MMRTNQDCSFHSFVRGERIICIVFLELLYLLDCTLSESFFSSNLLFITKIIGDMTSPIITTSTARKTTRAILGSVAALTGSSSLVFTARKGVARMFLPPQ